ncbi:MAG: DUF2892 domain-containing protein [Gammaproteobacteria bacterium]|jgi:hypothetical protein
MQNTYATYHNLGYIDRALRIGVGAVAILSVLAVQEPGTTLGWLGLIPLLAVYPILTGLIAFDPVYAWVGIDTSRSSVISDRNFNRLLGVVTGQAESNHGQNVPLSSQNNTTRRKVA